MSHRLFQVKVETGARQKGKNNSDNHGKILKEAGKKIKFSTFTTVANAMYPVAFQ